MRSIFTHNYHLEAQLTNVEEASITGYRDLQDTVQNLSITLLQPLFLNFEHHIYALQSWVSPSMLLSRQYSILFIYKKQRVEDLMTFDKEQSLIFL